MSVTLVVDNTKKFDSFVLTKNELYEIENHIDCIRNNWNENNLLSDDLLDHYIQLLTRSYNAAIKREKEVDMQEVR
jgi:hypothetical protein